MKKQLIRRLAYRNKLNRANSKTAYERLLEEALTREDYIDCLCQYLNFDVLYGYAKGHPFDSQVGGFSYRFEVDDDSHHGNVYYFIRLRNEQGQIKVCCHWDIYETIGMAQQFIKDCQ